MGLWLHSLCSMSFLILLALFSTIFASQPSNEALEKRLSQLEGEIIALTSRLSVNTADIKSNAGAIESNNEALENSAFVGVCAYRYETTTTGVITYDSIFSSYITDSSALSTSMGTFTASTSGLYMVTWSAHTVGHAQIWLFKQGVQMPDTAYVSNQPDEIAQGSRTVMVELCPGEEIYLWAYDNTRGIGQLHFCVTLANELPMSCSHVAILCTPCIFRVLVLALVINMNLSK